MLIPTRPERGYTYDREIKCCVCKQFFTDGYYWPGANEGAGIANGNDVWCENCYNSWLKRYERGNSNV